ncbi:MAG: SAM-dependent methyltransferase [Bryobacteraceae bacterium]|nr:SAM-dependent methyltransferase [Bryobacteraceae bacterium]
MTPVAEWLRAHIERHGPIRFDEFMRAALYHPEGGYYRTRDVFGRAGDFYTAEQIQPAFGLLIASEIRALRSAMKNTGEFRVVELGAGRGEMAPFLDAFAYTPVEWGRATLPERFSGVVFANEFFDALPVRVLVRRGNERWIERRVAFRDGRFHWVDGEDVNDEAAAFASSYFGEAAIAEVSLEALAWIDRIAHSLCEGHVLIVDYGYTTRELIRFPQGTLLSYSGHRAEEDVLAAPGSRDITAHVHFTLLADHATRLGMRAAPLETLAQTLLRAGERDHFAEVLREDDVRGRMQLKTLLFGMGETFRTLRLEKFATK